MKKKHKKGKERQVICDHCHGVFGISEIVGVKTHNINDDVVLTYYECPICFARYFVGIDNGEIRELKKQYKDDKTGEAYQKVALGIVSLKRQYADEIEDFLQWLS